MVQPYSWPMFPTFNLYYHHWIIRALEKIHCSISSGSPHSEFTFYTMPEIWQGVGVSKLPWAQCSSGTYFINSERMKGEVSLSVSAEFKLRRNAAKYLKGLQQRCKLPKNFEMLKEELCESRGLIQKEGITLLTVKQNVTIQKTNSQKPIIV